MMDQPPEAWTTWRHEDDRDGNGESNDGNGESNDREDRCKIKAGNSQLVQKHVQRLHPPEHQSDRE